MPRRLDPHANTAVHRLGETEMVEPPVRLVENGPQTVRSLDERESREVGDDGQVLRTAVVVSRVMPAAGKGFRRGRPVGVAADDIEVRNRHPPSVCREEARRSVFAHCIVRRVRRKRTACDLQVAGTIPPGRARCTLFRRTAPLNEKPVEMRPHRRDKSCLVKREVRASPNAIHTDEIRARPRHG